jgi:hypothetical protein
VKHEGEKHGYERTETLAATVIKWRDLILETTSLQIGVALLHS